MTVLVSIIALNFIMFINLMAQKSEEEAYKKYLEEYDDYGFMKPKKATVC